MYAVCPGERLFPSADMGPVSHPAEVGDRSQETESQWGWQVCRMKHFRNVWTKTYLLRKRVHTWLSRSIPFVSKRKLWLYVSYVGAFSAITHFDWWTGVLPLLHRNFRYRAIARRQGKQPDPKYAKRKTGNTRIEDLPESQLSTQGRIKQEARKYRRCVYWSRTLCVKQYERPCMSRRT